MFQAEGGPLRRRGQHEFALAQAQRHGASDAPVNHPARQSKQDGEIEHTGSDDGRDRDQEQNPRN